MNNAVIAGYVRSPFHFAHKGALVEKRPDDPRGRGSCTACSTRPASIPPRSRT